MSRHGSKYVLSEEMDLTTAVAAFHSLRLKNEVNKLIFNASVSEGQVQALVAVHPAPLERRCCFLARFIDGQTIVEGSNSLPWEH